MNKLLDEGAHDYVGGKYTIAEAMTIFAKQAEIKNMITQESTGNAGDQPIKPLGDAITKAKTKDDVRFRTVNSNGDGKQKGEPEKADVKIAAAAEVKDDVRFRKISPKAGKDCCGIPECVHVKKKAALLARLKDGNLDSLAKAAYVVKLASEEEPKKKKSFDDKVKEWSDKNPKKSIAIKAGIGVPLAAYGLYTANKGLHELGVLGDKKAAHTVKAAETKEELIAKAKEVHDEAQRTGKFVFKRFKNKPAEDIAVEKKAYLLNRLATPEGLQSLVKAAVVKKAIDQGGLQALLGGMQGGAPMGGGQQPGQDPSQQLGGQPSPGGSAGAASGPDPDKEMVMSHPQGLQFNLVNSFDNLVKQFGNLTKYLVPPQSQGGGADAAAALGGGGMGPMAPGAMGKLMPRMKPGNAMKIPGMGMA